MTKHNGIGNGSGKAGFSADEIAEFAHELRSPLGGIEAMVDLLASTNGNPDQDHVIDGLKAAAAHLRAVAADLVASSKGEVRRAAPVIDLVTSFSTASRARAGARGLAFADRIDRRCAGLRLSDSVAVRQILENLVDNAIRLTEGGEIVLDCTPVETSQGGIAIRLAVHDQGPGLTAEQAGQVFGRGVTLADRAGGSGLGLAIVADIVGRLGGRCGANGREDGQGATFWAELPASGSMRPAQPATLSPYRNPGQPILIVDDDVSSRALLTTVLDHLGFEAEACGSPLQALDIVRNRPVAAVMTDFAMPEMDGCALAAAIRALSGPGRLVPIIAVTGRVEPDSKAQMKAAGCDAIVEKPITIHDLRQALYFTELLSVDRKSVNAA